MQRFILSAILLGMSLAVSACATPGPVMRNAPADLSTAALLQMPSAEAETAERPVMPDWTVAQINVNVPQTLSVSEANSFKPRADIVWREDPLGNRHQQVADVMMHPLQELLPMLQGEREVIVQLDVEEFHAQTQRVRYSFGGDHEIQFQFTVFDAATGAPILGPEPRDLTFRALGGQEAVDSEARGIGQRERIQARLRDWAREEFALPIQHSGMTY